MVATYFSKLKHRVDVFLSHLPRGLTTFFALSFSSASIQIVRLFTGIVNARVLTPFLYAVNSLASTIVRYASYSHLGVQNALNRQLPIDYGKGDVTEAEVNLSSTFWYICTLSVGLTMIAGTLFLGNITFSHIIDREYYPDIWLLSVSTLFYQYFISFLISTKQFFLIAKLRMKFDVTGALLSVVVVYLFKLHGLLIALATLQIVEIFVIIGRTSFRVRRILSIGRIISMTKIGAPILITSLLIFFFTTMDLILVASKFERQMVGLYGFAITCVGFFRVYAMSISDVLAPKIGGHFGANNEEAGSLKIFATDYTFVMIQSLAMIAGVFFFVLPIIVRGFLPAYANSIAPYRFLLLSALSMTIYIPCGHITTILKKQKQTIILSIGVIVLTGLVLFLKIDSSATLVDVATIMCLATIPFSIGIVAIAHVFVFHGERFPWLSFGRNMLFYGFVMLMFFLTMQVPNHSFSNLWMGIIETLEFLVCESILLLSLFLFGLNNQLVNDVVKGLRKTGLGPLLPKAYGN